MMPKSHASAEAERLHRLQRYGILDTPPEDAFDGITQVAARLLNVPIAIVSLVDRDRIWFKSVQGLEVAETRRAPGLCASAILQDDPYVINDLPNDPRTLANPLVVAEAGLQFYAAVPLQTYDRHNLGTLCVIDRKPRTLAEEELDLLETLAGMVMDQMELRLSARRILKLNNELQEAYVQLRLQSVHDGLTRVLNREASLDALQLAIARSKRERQPVSVIALDVDHFKNINDTYGHDAGDRVLVEVASRLQQASRESDAVARFGGEEFIAVLFPCGADEAQVCAERLRQAVSAEPIPVDLDATELIRVTISAGVATGEGPCGYDTQELLKLADDALYEAKASGRNAVSVAA